MGRLPATPIRSAGRVPTEVGEGWDGSKHLLLRCDGRRICNCSLSDPQTIGGIHQRFGIGLIPGLSRTLFRAGGGFIEQGGESTASGRTATFIGRLTTNSSRPSAGDCR
jgi:hypothetical protein